MGSGVWLEACILEGSGMGKGWGGIVYGGMGNLGPKGVAGEALGMGGVGRTVGNGETGGFIPIPIPRLIAAAGMYCWNPGYIIGIIPHPWLIDIIWTCSCNDFKYSMASSNIDALSD